MHKMTLAAENTSLQISLNGTGTATINWGDGSPNQTFTLSRSDVGGKKTYLAGLGTRIITITGDNITYLGCADSGLTHLDVSQNPKLEVLRCQNNRLTILNLQRNAALRIVDCSNNNISTASMRNLFMSLRPVSGDTIAELSVSGNPNVSTCDPAMAIHYGWILSDFPFKIPVTNLSLDKAAIAIEAGKSEKLTPVFTPSDATLKQIKWLSNNSSVTVDANGMISISGTATASQATVTAITVDRGRRAACTVTVKPASASTSVPIPAPTPASISANRLATAKLEDRIAAANVQDIPVISNLREVPAISNIREVSTASSLREVPATSKLEDVLVTSKLEDSKIRDIPSISTPEESVTSNFKDMPANLKDIPKFDDKFVPLRPEESPVSENNVVKSIKLNKYSVGIAAGSFEQLEVIFEPADATFFQKVVWKSDSPNLVIVDDNGRIRVSQSAQAGFQATITASISDRSNNISASCVVTVIPEDMLLLLKWISPGQRDQLREAGIFDVPGLLMKGRTPEQRQILAASLRNESFLPGRLANIRQLKRSTAVAVKLNASKKILNDSRYISAKDLSDKKDALKDTNNANIMVPFDSAVRTPTDSDVPVASKPDIDLPLITFWIKQADLWRVDGMDPDTACLLVQIGVRHIVDLAKLDFEKAYPLMRRLFESQSGLSLINEIALQKLIRNAGDMTGYTLHQNKFDDLISMKSKEREGGLSESAIKNILVSSKYSFSLNLEIDEKEPAYLFRRNIGLKSSGKVIREGLDFLDEIDRVLPLPRFISGRIYMRQEGKADSDKISFHDALVDIEGISSPSADKIEAENPTGHTDGDGRFHIILPDGYNLQDSITITISKNSGKQKFVRNASDILNSLKEEQEILNSYDRLDALGKQIQIEASKLYHLDWLNDVLSDPYNPYNADEKLEMNREKESLELQEPKIKESIDLQRTEYQKIKDKILDYDKSTNDLEQTLRNLLSKKTEADLGEFILVKEIFEGRSTGLKKALPSVKLMGSDDKAIHLPTDKAPSRVFNYGMVQRLVEPAIYPPVAANQQRQSLEKPVNVMDFKEKLYSNPDDYPQMASLGIGYILNMHQAWVPDGFALGTLLYSLVLAPGEEQRLIVREKTQSYVVSDESEGTDIDNQTFELARTDDVDAAFGNAVNRMSMGNSEYDYWAKTESKGGGFGAGYGTSAYAVTPEFSLAVVNGITGSFSKSNSKASGGGTASANQSNLNKEASSAAQSFQHNIKSAADRISQAKRVSVRAAAADEKDSAATKIIANRNHSHTLTVQYWEVMRRYCLETCIDGVDLVVFVPLKVIRFLPDGTLYSPNKQSDFNRDKFMGRYSMLLKYADALFSALPYPYRTGMNLVKKYAAMPNWIAQPLTAGTRTLTLSFKCDLLSFDDVTASLVLKNKRRTIAGFVNYTRQELPITYQTIMELKQGIRDIRNKNSSHSVNCTFMLPSDITDDDLSHITLNHSCDRLEYTLSQRTSLISPGEKVSWVKEAKERYKGLSAHRKDLYLNPEETVAYLNMVNKMNNLAEDFKDNFHDKRKIEHYKSQLPESYRTPIVSLSPRDIMSEGAPMMSDVNLRLNGGTMGFMISSGNLLSSVTLRIENTMPVLRYAELQEMEALMHHIATEALYYSQVVWASLSEDERAVMLEQYTIDMNFDNLTGNKTETQDNIDIPLLNCVNVKKMLGFYGNCILLPFTYPKSLADKLGKSSAEVQDALYRYHTYHFRVPQTTISLPTDGMIGEAVLGETNVSELIDLTRFWNWKDSPIDSMTLDNSYLNNTDYLAGKAPGGITPFNMTGATHSSAVGTADLIAALAGKKIPAFDNLTGLDQLKDLVNEGTKSAANGRKELFEHNKQLTQTALDYATKASEGLMPLKKAETPKGDGQNPKGGEQTPAEGEQTPAGGGRGGGNQTPAGGGRGSGGGQASAGGGGDQASTGGGRGSGGQASAGGGGGGGNSNVVTVYCCSNPAHASIKESNTGGNKNIVTINDDCVNETPNTVEDCVDETPNTDEDCIDEIPNTDEKERDE
ncbi:MAG: Ig-like domain-containing protein [Methanosarcinales archaeon]|jgi:hypothetical protein|nr:Ig-like domain-containing protein [Methanosarcinales archaeon]